jgi:trk system potassium uptake protein TrkA
MRVLIIGCGRVGAATATELDRRGEHVTVVDTDQRAFLRLSPKFAGSTVRGSGTDEAVLREAGAEMADLLMALTEGDNRNALAAQMGKHLFRVPRVIAKINDPVRAEAYRSLGLETICRTVILSESLITAALQGADATNGAVEAPTAEPLHGPSPPGARPLVTSDKREAPGDDSERGERPSKEHEEAEAG